MIWRVLIIIILGMMAVGASYYNNGISVEKFNNFTDKVGYDQMNMTTYFYEDSNNENNSFIVRAVYKYGDFMMFMFSEGSREAVKFGYENPQFNFMLMMKLLVLSVVAMLVVPAIYLVLFMGYGIKALVIWIKTKYKGGYKNGMEKKKER